MVGVRDGRIAAVGELSAPLDAWAFVELGEDEVLLPVLVDTHVHANEPGRTEWEGFASATRAAAAGGVTTILDMPLNSIPPTCTVDALEIKRSRVHVVHLSSAQVLPVIRAARRDGVPLTVETCPHYLVFTAEEIPEGATEFHRVGRGGFAAARAVGRLDPGAGATSPHGSWAAACSRPATSCSPKGRT